MATKHACLRTLPIKQDLRGKFTEGRAAAWRWAMTTLLRNSSRTIVYNLNRWRYPGRTRPQRPSGSAAWGPATLIDVDFVSSPLAAACSTATR